MTQLFSCAGGRQRNLFLFWNEMPQPTAPASGPLLVLCARLPLAGAAREGALAREAPTVKDDADSEGDTAATLKEGHPLSSLLTLGQAQSVSRLGAAAAQNASQSLPGPSSSSFSSPPHQVLWSKGKWAGRSVVLACATVRLRGLGGQSPPGPARDLHSHSYVRAGLGL